MLKTKDRIIQVDATVELKDVSVVLSASLECGGLAPL